MNLFNRKKHIFEKMFLILTGLLFLSCTGGSFNSEKAIEEKYAATIDAQVDYQEIYERADVSQTIEYVNITSPIPTPSPIPLVDFTLAANPVSVEDGMIHVSKKKITSQAIADEGGEISIGLPVGAFLVFFTAEYQGIETFLGYLSFIKFGGEFFNSLIETEASAEVTSYLKNMTSGKKLSGKLDVGKLKFDEAKGIVYPEEKEKDPYCSIDSDNDGMFDCNDADANGNGILDKDEFKVPIIDFANDEYTIKAGENLEISGAVLDEAGDLLSLSTEISPVDADFIDTEIEDDKITLELSPLEKDIGFYEITITATNKNGTAVKVIEIDVVE